MASLAVASVLSAGTAHAATPPTDTHPGTPPGAGAGSRPDPKDFRWDLSSRLSRGPRLKPGVPVQFVIPKRERGGYTAKVLARTPVLDAPDGRHRVWTATAHTMHTKNATRLSVRAARFDATGRPWLGVQLPLRPNGSLGWVRYDKVVLGHTRYFVSIRLRQRRIEVYSSGRRLRSSRVVIGAPSTPTPTGDFAVYEIADQGSPNGFLGPWALHLTAFSTVLDNYGGGPGRVAIHGRGPASIRDARLGTAGSHGCVRIPNSMVSWMHSRTLGGTPVRISQR